MTSPRPHSHSNETPPRTAISESDLEVEYFPAGEPTPAEGTSVVDLQAVELQAQEPEAPPPNDETAALPVLDLSMLPEQQTAGAAPPTDDATPTGQIDAADEPSAAANFTANDSASVRNVATRAVATGSTTGGDEDSHLERDGGRAASSGVVARGGRGSPGSFVVGFTMRRSSGWCVLVRRLRAAGCIGGGLGAGCCVRRVRRRGRGV